MSPTPTPTPTLTMTPGPLPTSTSASNCSVGSSGGVLTCHNGTWTGQAILITVDLNLTVDVAVVSSINITSGSLSLGFTVLYVTQDVVLNGDQASLILQPSSVLAISGMNDWLLFELYSFDF
jgi:hypothetical protein